MAATEIRFTALPNGVSGEGNVRVAIFVSYLVPTGGLPAYLTSPPNGPGWPAVADALDFEVDIRNSDGSLHGGSLQTRRLPSDALDVATDVWSAVFPNSVNATARSVRKLKPILTYPVNEIASSLDEYHGLAAAASSQGDVSSVAQQILEDNNFKANLKKLDQFLGLAAPNASARGANQIFMEFHNRTTALIQYPTVLRTVRLVIDVEVLGLDAANPRN